MVASFLINYHLVKRVQIVNSRVRLVKRHSSVRIALILVTWWMAERCAFAAEKELPARPNIVLIMADDLGFSDLGCYGGEIRTPNLDRTAQRGLRFRQFYNCGLCSPSRYCLMTGRWPDRALRLSNQTPTIAELLHKAGYTTSISGKWNLQNQEPSLPLDWGFDRFYGTLDGADNHLNPAMTFHPLAASGRRPLAPFRLVWDDRRMQTAYPADFDLTDAVADHAARTIRDLAMKKSPFFVYVPFYAPHIPLQAKPEAIAACKARYAVGWDRLREQRFERAIAQDMTDANWKLGKRSPDIGPWANQSHQEWQALRMAVYAAMVETMDAGIGRILESIEVAGVQGNTLVMFLSDNGGKADPDLPMDRPDIEPGSLNSYCTPGLGWGTLMNAPFRGAKQTTSEGGIASPFIACWPGQISPNTITSDVAHLIDVLPTVLELTHADSVPTSADNEHLQIDGRSLVPVLKGQQRSGHDRLYWHFSRERLQGDKVVDAGFAAAMRQGQWKLNWNDEAREWELFDLKRDRTETTDLSAQYPDRVRQMKQDLNTWQRQQGFTNPQ